MKKLYTAVSTLLILFLIHTTSANPVMKSDSVVLSANYVNEAYYSMYTGSVQTAPRATWDIAFRTMKQSSSILTNDGSGVVLYTYPHADTSGWALVDTTGLHSWTPMFNDPTDWENGAFSRNAIGHPDYGWGIYNMVTHNLTGDSLFVIKLRDNSFRKLRIIGKQSAANIYNFRFANLDGSSEQTVSLDLNAKMDMEFYGYSLLTNEPVAFQPPKESWDLLFTKYMSVQPNGTPYLVTGVLTNNPVSSKKFHPVDLTYNDFGQGKWDSTRSAIGWDWKVFEMTTFQYKIVDSTVYFVKRTNEDIYKLVFTAFAGSGTGIIKFDTEMAAGAGVFEFSGGREPLMVYPNPARDIVNIVLPDRRSAGLSILLTDLSGRQLRADRPEAMADGQSVYPFDVTGVQPGTYFVTVLNAASVSVAKILIVR